MFFSSASTSVAGNADPFTGSSSYTTSTQTSVATLFPVKVYRAFDTGDPQVVINKIKEFNGNVPDDLKVSESDLESLIPICKGPATDLAAFELLYKLLQWPDNVVFPVLDVVRMVVQDATNNQQIVSSNGEMILGKLVSYINSSSSFANNIIVAMRAICNLCLHPYGETVVFESR